MLSSVNQRLQQDRSNSSVMAQGCYDAVAAQPISQLDGYMNAITSVITQLEANIGNLMRHLNPILQEENSPTACTNKGIEALVRSPLIDELATHKNRLHALNELVTNIQARLVV